MFDDSLIFCEPLFKLLDDLGIKSAREQLDQCGHYRDYVQQMAEDLRQWQRQVLRAEQERWIKEYDGKDGN